MNKSTFGTIFRLSTFGESHGPAIGGILDGCPAGLDLDFGKIRHEMQRRRPGQSALSSPRMETDDFEILSGMLENKTLGTPIGFIIRNKDSRPEDYSELEHVFRPSHADFTYQEKYGIRDHRGGGRASARETAARVFAGAVAKQFLARSGIQISAYVSQIGRLSLDKDYHALDLSTIESSVLRCPDKEMSDKMEQLVSECKSEGDSVGGVISCIIQHVPAGLGEPVFAKMQASLAAACLSINAVHGFEYGSGFAGAAMKGSEHNDEFYTDKEGKIRTRSNFSGGIQGGITNGMDIYFRVAFKPVATIQKEQGTVNVQGEYKTVAAKGRHDPCVVPRAVPIVEAMSAIVLADFLLLSRCSKI